MTKDGIGSKLTYHGIISPFATIKQHEKLNNGHPHFIQSHTETNPTLKRPNSWKHIQSFFWSFELFTDVTFNLETVLLTWQFQRDRIIAKQLSRRPYRTMILRDQNWWVLLSRHFELCFLMVEGNRSTWTKPRRTCWWDLILGRGTVSAGKIRALGPWGFIFF